MRTYSREAFLAAKAAWETGDFSEEWTAYRVRAADRGMLYPPEGTRWDSWEDDSPSQRAMLVRAIRETPALLISAIDRSRSWYEVIEKLNAGRDRLREDATLREKDAEWERQGYRGQVESWKAIFGRLRDSA